MIVRLQLIEGRNNMFKAVTFISLGKITLEIYFFDLDAAPVFVDLPMVLEVSENNQRGQIITNIHGNAKSRWNQNASIRYTIVKGK